jgi:hypothetical protein
MDGLTFQIIDPKLLEAGKKGYDEVEKEKIEDGKTFINIILGAYHRQENA